MGMDNKVDEYYSEGVEEMSWILSSALSARFEEDMSDPWDIVEA